MLTEEKLEFTRPLLVSGNLGLLAWVFLAFFALFLYNQILGWLYLLALSFLIYAILRRIGCSSCYKCKTGTSGFGRLAGAFFGTGFVKKESIGNRIGMTAFVYVLLFPLPVAFLSISLLEAFSFLKVFVLVSLLALAVYSLTTWFICSTTKIRVDLGEGFKRLTIYFNHTEMKK